jgi:periplasmic protein TonB
MRRVDYVAIQLLSGLALVLPAAAQSPSPPPLLARPSPETRPTAVLTVTGDQVWKFTISHPTPEYPIQARRRHLTGTGIYELRVEDSGEVSSVTVLSSAGYPILDDAAIEGLKRWRFRPHTTLVRAKVPITFSMPRKLSQSKEKT